MCKNAQLHIEIKWQDHLITDLLQSLVTDFDQQKENCEAKIRKLVINWIVGTHVWCRVANIAKQWLCSSKNISIRITFNKAISIHVTYKEYICKCWFKTGLQNRSPTDLSKTPCRISPGDLIPLFLSCSALKKLEQKDPTAVYFSYVFWWVMGNLFCSVRIAFDTARFQA